MAIVHLLEAVLLSHDNSLRPVPVFYGIEMNETYGSMKFILEKINYASHMWRVICDLKVIGQYAQKNWMKRDNRQIGQHNVINEALVPIENILLPPLHIKLGIVKSFIKALDRNGDGFQYLRTIFPRLSEAKLKEGMFSANTNECFAVLKHFCKKEC